MTNIIETSLFLKLFEDDLKFIPSVLVHEFFDYWYTICVDCNKYLLKPYTCRCGSTRCIYHHVLNVAEYGCIVCHNDVYYDEYTETRINCKINNCVYKAYYGDEKTITTCHWHSKYDMIFYDICNFEKCLFRSQYKNKQTNLITCKYHMKSNTEYIYNIVKN